MKLQSQLNRRIGETVYRKWYIHLRNKDVAELGWEMGKGAEAGLHLERRHPDHTARQPAGRCDPNRSCEQDE